MRTNMLKQLAHRCAAANATRSTTAASMRFVSTTSHPIDNNAFVNGMTEEQATKALERGQEIRNQHHAAKDSFPSVR